MSKRDLLKRANAGNAQNRGTQAVLNDESTDTDNTIKEHVLSVEADKNLTTTSEDNKGKLDIPEKAAPLQKEGTEDARSSISSVNTINTKISSKNATNISSYTGQKTSKSIMLSKEDNIFLIKQAASTKKPIQDVFAEIMAAEIMEVKNNNIDHSLADEFLLLRANNMRRNVSIPKDLIEDIENTAALIPLKSGKFIQYALYKARANN